MGPAGLGVMAVLCLVALALALTLGQPTQVRESPAASVGREGAQRGCGTASRRFSAAPAAVGAAWNRRTSPSRSVRLHRREDNVATEIPSTPALAALTQGRRSGPGFGRVH